MSNGAWKRGCLTPSSNVALSALQRGRQGSWRKERGNDMTRLLVAAVAVAILSGAAFASPSFLGITGNILTPSDEVLMAGDFSAGMFMVQSDNTPFVIGANVGVNNQLEVGFGHYDPDVAGVGSNTFFSFKYSVIEETEAIPSLVIGAIDVTGELDPNDDPGFYAVLGKNITPFASNLMGKPISPIHAMVGIGGGIYNGFFGGLDWELNEQISLSAEYVNSLSLMNMFDKKSMMNFGVRLAFSESLTASGAIIDGNDFAFGLSFVRAGIDL